jgi:A/G-specific adenine glycosylase
MTEVPTFGMDIARMDGGTRRRAMRTVSRRLAGGGRRSCHVFTHFSNCGWTVYRAQVPDGLRSGPDDGWW